MYVARGLQPRTEFIARPATPYAMTLMGFQMNYQYHYDKLVEKYGTWDKPEAVYTERHRKLPGYLDGEYTKGNAFYMSARAHYLAHLLWAKITRHPEAWLAVKQMAGDNRFNKTVRTNSKMYQTAKLLSRPAVIESCRKAGRIGGLAQKERGEGIHAQTREDHVQIGLIAVLNKTGIHGLTPEETKRNSQKGATRRTEMIQSGELVIKTDGELMRKVVKETNKQVWECDECGYRNRACGVGNHQRRTKHIGKTRVV